ncbi:MAG: ASKHA domain-containing protein [Bacillota bacterium]
MREGRVTCCSCASGPAFEGGHVSRGMRALAGAVDRVWLEGEEIRYTVVGGGEPAGFCGAGLIDLLAVLLRAKVMDAGGRLRAGAPGVEEGADGLEFRLGGVSLTQRDIRQLQLAKAAVRSGIEGLLADHGHTGGGGGEGLPGGGVRGGDRSRECRGRGHVSAAAQGEV